MRVHPWRKWLGAQLRGLADTVELGDQGIRTPGPYRAAESPVGDATTSTTTAAATADSADSGGGAVSDPGRPELVRGLNLTGAPEHWARLVRESASGGGNDNLMAAGPPVVRPVEGAGPRRPAPDEPERPFGHQPSRPPEKRDRRAATAKGVGERAAVLAPSAPELPDGPGPDHRGASIPPAAQGVSPSVEGRHEPRTATLGRRLVLRPPGSRRRWAGPQATAEQIEGGSNASMAPVPVTETAGPASTRLSLSPGFRAEAGRAGTARSPAEPPVGSDHGDMPPTSPSSQRAAAGRPSPGGGLAGDVVPDARPASRRADTNPPAVPAGAASADPTAAAIVPNDRWPDRETSPAEPGRWPELPTRPTATTVQQPSAVARMLTRFDRLNQEQAAV